MDQMMTLLGTKIYIHFINFNSIFRLISEVFFNWQNFSRRVSEVHNVLCGNKHSVTKVINLTEMQVQINNSNGSGDYTSFRLTESWITELIAFQIGSM